MKTDDNGLIAEFMGAIIPEGRGIYSFLKNIEFCSAIEVETKNGEYLFTPSQLKFDKSWNWLMPVVEKIGNIWDLNEIGTEAEKVLKMPISSHIQQVHKAVVEFIKWYNSQKP